MAQSENLDPQALNQVEFATVRRGYHPDQVRDVIGQAAGALTAAQRRLTELEQALHEIQSQPPPSVDDLDDNELMLRLGDKTVRVLEAARESAVEVEGKAQQRAGAALKRAKEQSLQLQAQSEKALRTAQHRVESLEKESERKAHDVRKAAEAESDRMRGQAEETLRSARADGNHIETEAGDRADRLNSEASETAARAKAKVDALVLATRTQIEEQRAAADQELDRLRHETEQGLQKQMDQVALSAQRTLDDASAKAARIEVEADTRYEERVAAGRQHGRELVAEAENKRTEVLSSIASTRRRAQLNIEQLRLGRERLLEAYAVARATIDQATGEIDEALPEAKEIAERLVARVGDDEERSLGDLEAEFELDRLSDLRVLSDDDDPEATRIGAEQVGSKSPTDGGDNETGTDEEVADPEADAPEPAPVDVDPTDDEAHSPEPTDREREPATASD